MKSNIFDIHNHKQVNIKFNKILGKLINVETAAYDTSTRPFIEIMRNKDICQYQHKLLAAAFNHLDSSVQLDCDCLDLTTNLSKGDVRKLLNEDKGITAIKTKQRQSLISIMPTRLGAINQGWCPRDGKNVCPWYTQAFSVACNETGDKLATIHIADGTGKEADLTKTALRISCNPNRFGDFKGIAIFSQIQSVIGTRRYEQSFNNANVTRVDIGFNIYGLLSAFAVGIIDISDSKFRESRIFSKLVDNTSGIINEDEEKFIVETVWLGDRIMIRVYDKTMERMHKDSSYKSVYDTCSMTTRFEYQNCPYEGTSIKLTEIVRNPTTLADLEVLNPMIFPRLSDKQLSLLLTNKRNHVVRKHKRKINRIAEDNIIEPWLSLNRNWVRQEQTTLLIPIKKMILSPKKFMKDINHED